jgi:predicted nicotinamide N-methyase
MIHALNGSTATGIYDVRPLPSSIALATAFLSQPDIVSGKKVADVGCGLGLAGVAAALSGAKHVVFLDREPLALECALLNAQLYGIQREQCSIGDGIRFPFLPDQFMDTLVRSDNPHLREVQITAQIFDWSVEIAKQEDFDLVLMCDVLYESFSVEVRCSVVFCDPMKHRASKNFGS